MTPIRGGALGCGFGNRKGDGNGIGYVALAPNFLFPSSCLGGGK
jgi:hypothetical protein